MSRTEPNALVALRDVTKEYQLGHSRVVALRNVTLALARGSFAAIAGPSGSGKTTLLNLIGCLDLPTSGSVSIDGTDVAQLSDDELSHLRARKLGFIFQTFNLIPVLSVYENIEYPLRLNGASRAEMRQRTWELIEAVGLQEHARHRPNELSGGQRQRVAVARALVTRPELVLADEPTANLDSETGSRVLHLMKEMHERLGTTFLFTTHDPIMMTEAKQTFYVRDGALHADPAYAHESLLEAP